MQEFDIDKCKIKAKTVEGKFITFKISDLRYDPFDDIYWYEDKSLRDLKVITPNFIKNE